MTIVAVLSDLPEDKARALADLISEDDVLSERAFDLSESAPKRWRIALYFEEVPGRTEKERLAALAGRGRFTFDELPELDWVAKSLEGLKPVRAGRFLVHGRHDRGAVRPNDIGIEIEAGQAFGTGHHGTTAGCLAAIDQVAKARIVAHALDVGTGSGVLAIALAKRCKAHVTATDIDPVAVKVARENIRLNGVAGYANAITTGSLDGRAIAEHTPYDLIVANILAGPLVALAPAIGRHAAGTVILSGLLPEQRARIVASYRSVGLCLSRWSTRDGWLTMVLSRARRLQRM